MRWLALFTSHHARCQMALLRRMPAALAIPCTRSLRGGLTDRLCCKWIVRGSPFTVVPKRACAVLKNPFLVRRSNSLPLSHHGACTHHGAFSFLVLLNYYHQEGKCAVVCRVPWLRFHPPSF